jgi:hypothetical protein
MQRALDSEALCEHPAPDSWREREDLFFDGCVDAPLGMHESLSGRHGKSQEPKQMCLIGLGSTAQPKRVGRHLLG